MIGRSPATAALSGPAGPSGEWRTAQTCRLSLSRTIKHGPTVTYGTLGSSDEMARALLVLMKVESSQDKEFA